MKKYVLVIMVGLFSMVSSAHNPDVSTTMLVEKENNVWVLQVSASLTAFQQEIQLHFSETPYKTSEEFLQLVLEHIKNNIQLHFNGAENVTLGHGVVKLGHETQVVFEVLGVPIEMHSVEVTNTAFKDIHKSQSVLVLLKENFKKNQFVLRDSNNHKVSLLVNGNEFVEKTENKASFFSVYSMLVLLGFLGLGFLIQKIYKQQKSPLLKNH